VRHVARGMTLIEVLVSLAALSLLAVGMIAAFRIAHRTYERVNRVERAYWDVAVAQRFLRDTLESAYPFEPPVSAGVATTGLAGTSDRIDVTSVGRLASSSTGHRRYSVFVKRREDGYGDVVATSVLDRNGAPAATAPMPPSSEETLIARVQDVEWAYLGGAGDDIWHGTWSSQRLPALVRLRVQFPAGDSRRWPDLIVAPRVTDDANCSFDVVSQACRQPQS
jgi:general secretion pathway protein J